MLNLNSEPNPQKQIEMKRLALYHFQKSREIYPGFWNVSYDIGRVYLSLNMQDSAIAAFEYALRVGSDFVEIHRSLAELYFTMGKLDQAIPHLEFMIKSNPTDFSNYDKLGYIFYKKGDFQSVVDINKSAVQYFPNIVEPLINIGRGYIEMNQVDSAKVYLSQANKMAPGHPMVQELLKQVNL